MYIYTYIHTYIHTYLRAYVHTHIHTHIHIYIQTCPHTHTHTHTRTPIYMCTGSGVWRSRHPPPSLPPSMVWSGRGGGLEGGVLLGGRSGVTGRAGIYRTKSPVQAINPITIMRRMLLLLLTLTCTLNPTPNSKPRLNAVSKPKAKHKPSTLTNLHPEPTPQTLPKPLSTRSLMPFN